MCIRALDYCPPVDLTFGDYLRALITADTELIRDDDLGYRVAMVEAFRRRGLYPADVRSLAPDSLLWDGLDDDFGPLGSRSPLRHLQRAPVIKANSWNLAADRRRMFDYAHDLRRELHGWIENFRTVSDPSALRKLTGLTLGNDAPAGLKRGADGHPRFEVHAVYPVRRVGPDGQLELNLVIEVTQQRQGFRDPDRQDQSDRGLDAGRSPADFTFRGGCTVVFDLETATPRYVIKKDILSESRLHRRRAYLDHPGSASLRATYFGARWFRTVRDAPPRRLTNRSLPMKARRPSPTTTPRVRMYRPGFGDCFLVSLPGSSSTPFHLLLDCGVHAGTPGEVALMNRVARDVAATTGGRLDIVVASHDHWDHLSGFLQARSVFDQIEIGEVWLSWAEDPADVEAEALRSRRGRDLRGLRVLANRLSNPNRGPNGPAADRVRVPLSFFGPESGAGSSAALDVLRDHRSRPRVRYRRLGGSAVPLTGSAGSLAYLLGPSPERSRDGSGSAAVALFAASGGLPAEDAELAGLADAFDVRYRLAPAKAERQSFFRQKYLAGDKSWHPINLDWLGPAAPLALDLDARTSDLSLALAIEVEPGGRVLRFPGDAQAARWADWRQLRWPGLDRSRPATTVNDLLGRTVLYKVGHHGAAGATPQPNGLDLMTHPDLVAMLPTDAGCATAAGWSIPDPDLSRRLVRATRGRLLRSDQLFPDRPEGVPIGEWEAFRGAVSFDPAGLHIDFHLGC